VEIVNITPAGGRATTLFSAEASNPGYQRKNAHSGVENFGTESIGTPTRFQAGTAKGAVFPYGKRAARFTPDGGDEEVCGCLLGGVMGGSKSFRPAAVGGL